MAFSGESCVLPTSVVSSAMAAAMSASPVDSVVSMATVASAAGWLGGASTSIGRDSTSAMACVCPVQRQWCEKRASGGKESFHHDTRRGQRPTQPQLPRPALLAMTRTLFMARAVAREREREAGRKASFGRFPPTRVPAKKPPRKWKWRASPADVGEKRPPCDPGRHTYPCSPEYTVYATAGSVYSRQQ